MPIKYSDAHWDHERDLRKHEPRPTDPAVKRVMAVSYLTAYLDSLLRMNAIPAEYRDGVRDTVNTTRKAFDLPDLGPSEHADA
jgi:hypothetical protein